MSASEGTHFGQVQDLVLHLTTDVLIGIPGLVLGIGIVLMIFGVPRKQVGAFAIRVFERLLRMKPAEQPEQRAPSPVLREINERPSG